MGWPKWCVTEQTWLEPAVAALCQAELCSLQPSISLRMAHQVVELSESPVTQLASADVTLPTQEVAHKQAVQVVDSLSCRTARMLGSLLCCAWPPAYLRRPCIHLSDTY